LKEIIEIFRSFYEEDPCWSKLNLVHSPLLVIVLSAEILYIIHKNCINLNDAKTTGDNLLKLGSVYISQTDVKDFKRIINERDDLYDSWTLLQIAFEN